MTSPRQRMMAILRGQEPDALPLLADLAYWFNAHREDGTLDSRYQHEEGYMRLHEDLGCVYYYDYANYSPDGFGVLTSSAEEDVETDERTHGHETVHILKTRSGELTARSIYVPASHSSALVEYWVKRPEDLRIIREYVESVRFSPDYEGFLKRDEHIGERGLSLACPPQSPLAVLMVRFAGVQTTSYLSVDAPDEFEKTLECIDQAWDPAFELMCESPAYLFHFADNLSAENVAGFCDRYLAPYYLKRVAQLHAAGKIAVTHLDGTIKGLLGRIAATGMDGVEALVPAPIGDVALEDIRSEAGSDEVILWGGLPGALFSHPYGTGDILRQVDTIRRVFGTTGRFIPGTADQVPPDADIELVRIASQALALA